jgi:hypothetical protein
MIIPHDAWGNPLPRPEDRLRGSLVRRSTAAAADPRDAEIAALKARISELELALTASATVPSSASVSATSSATPARKNKNTAPTITAAKLKEAPWTALGISRRTYYRRKKAG